jgi:hypothetical protein
MIRQQLNKLRVTGQSALYAPIYFKAEWSVIFYWRNFRLSPIGSEMHQSYICQLVDRIVLLQLTGWVCGFMRLPTLRVVKGVAHSRFSDLVCSEMKRTTLCRLSATAFSPPPPPYSQLSSIVGRTHTNQIINLLSIYTLHCYRNIGTIINTVEFEFWVLASHWAECV